MSRRFTGWPLEPGWTTELLPKGYVKPLNDTFIQAVCEGIGVYFSSGDDGDEFTTMGYSTVDWPACSPWVTAVGGTSLAIGENKTRLFETGWGTSSYVADPLTGMVSDTGSWLYGGGGGVSNVFATPWYQNGLGLSGRGVPDAAALGDPQTGFLVGQTQQFSDCAYYDEYRIGGTSLSCPIFAGLMALAQQKAGQGYGFANPWFYTHSEQLKDIVGFQTATVRRNFNNGENESAGTVDRVRTFNDYSGSPTQYTAFGWDPVTGLGVPNGVFAK